MVRNGVLKKTWEEVVAACFKISRIFLEGLSRSVKVSQRSCVWGEIRSKHHSNINRVHCRCTLTFVASSLSSLSLTIVSIHCSALFCTWHVLNYTTKAGYPD
jgi:hypothetical protein